MKYFFLVVAMVAPIIAMDNQLPWLKDINAKLAMLNKKVDGLDQRLMAVESMTERLIGEFATFKDEQNGYRGKTEAKVFHFGQELEKHKHFVSVPTYVALRTGYMACYQTDEPHNGGRLKGISQQTETPLETESPRCDVEIVLETLSKK